MLGVYDYIIGAARSGDFGDVPIDVPDPARPATGSEQLKRVPDFTRVEDCRKLREGLAGGPTVSAIDYLAEHAGQQ